MTYRGLPPAARWALFLAGWVAQVVRWRRRERHTEDVLA